jgi:hypothetical protein
MEYVQTESNLLRKGSLALLISIALQLTRTFSVSANVVGIQRRSSIVIFFQVMMSGSKSEDSSKFIIKRLKIIAIQRQDGNLAAALINTRNGSAHS